MDNTTRFIVVSLGALVICAVETIIIGFVLYERIEDSKHAPWLMLAAILTASIVNLLIMAYLPHSLLS